MREFCHGLVRLMIVSAILLLTATAQISKPPDPSMDIVYVCPMDRDIRSNMPGNCPRCGMKLTAGIPEPVEFHLDLTVTPKPAKPGQTTRLRFDVRDPWKNNLVRKFTTVHEKLFHAFVVSEDLEFFQHGHPVWESDAFNYETVLPKPGMYRVLGDFYPEASTPQLLTKTIYALGTPARVTPLTRDYAKKAGENLSVELTTQPAEPLATSNTQMRFRIQPADGIEKYLGAWGHMLAASDDLIDMMHSHPMSVEAGPDIQFDLTFPRARVYRVWVQFQRSGVVNTVHFDIPVKTTVSSAAN